jgi:hypothetical protein
MRGLFWFNWCNGGALEAVVMLKKQIPCGDDNKKSKNKKGKSKGNNEAVSSS